MKATTKKAINKSVEITTTEQLSLGDLALYISNVVDIADAAIFVALLDKFYEDWGVTNDLINHFDALKETMIENLERDEYELKPELIEL